MRIEKSSVESPVAQRALDLFPADKVTIIEDGQNAEENQGKNGSLSAEEFNLSKRRLLIKKFAGQFFKRCPGSTQKKTLTCCNYYVLNLGSQCHFNCSYCYLQSYLNNRSTIIYSNLSDAINELAEMSKLHGSLPFRVGTGEIIDSLGLDPLTLYSRALIEAFRQWPAWTLELKTKSNFVDQFLDVEHAGNVVVSWSVNTDTITRQEEHGTAALSERLEAAQKCVARGFKVAFHIDPMINYKDWEKDYLDLAKQIATQFRPEDVHVISLGTLRFQPEQRHLMRERFGMKSLVTSAEMFQSNNGKMRYDSKLRQGMYEHVLKAFKTHDPAWKLFMCMETPETWINTFENFPMKVPEIAPLFRPLPQI